MSTAAAHAPSRWRKTSSRGLAFFALMCLLCKPVRCQNDEPIQEFSAKFVRNWIDVADYCYRKRARTLTLRALSVAEELGATDQMTEELKGKTLGLYDDSGQSRRGLEKRFEKARRALVEAIENRLGSPNLIPSEVSVLYRMAVSSLIPKAERMPIFLQQCESLAKLGEFETALELLHLLVSQGDLDASGDTRLETDALRQEIERRVKEEDWQRAGDLVMIATELDSVGTSAGRYRQLERRIAERSLLMIRSSDHEMVGWLSLPELDGTSSTRTNLIIVLEGARMLYKSLAEEWKRTAGNEKFAFLVPVTTSNTPVALKEFPYPYKTAPRLSWSDEELKWDSSGLRSLIRSVTDDYGVDQCYYICGVSGGGHLLHHWVALHSRELKAAAGGGANFLSTNMVPVKDQNSSLPIRFFLGELDTAKGVDYQYKEILKYYKNAGWKNTQGTIVQSKGHVRFIEEFIGFFLKVEAERAESQSRGSPATPKKGH